MDRREAMKVTALFLGTGLAGCAGSNEQETTTTGSQPTTGAQSTTSESDGLGENGNLPDNVMRPSDWDFVDWNAPQPAAQRLSSTEDWTPPEFDDSNVSTGPIQWTNSGGVDGDPATMFTAKMLNEKLGIKATPIAVPSPRLQVKNLTPLSARSAEPLMFHLNRQMYMDFVEPGWLEPLDPLYTDSEGIDAYNPGPYKSGSGSLWTDVDSTMDGKHIYGGVWTAGGHFMHYRPDFLEELGFEPDLFDGVNTDYDWSDCLEVWRAARKQKDIYGFTWHAKTPRFAVRWWMADVLAQGGQIISDDGRVQIDTKEGRQAVEWEKQLMEENLVPNVLEMTQGTAIEQFLNGDTLSITHGGKVYNSALDRIGKEGEKVGMGIPPKADRGPDPWHATLTVYATLVMNRFAPTEKKRAGLLFMDAQRAAVSEVQEFLMEGNMPQVSPAFEKMQEETQYAHVMKAWAENSVDPMWPRQLQSQNLIGEELQKAWGGQKATDAALKDAQAAVNDMLYQS